MADASPENQDLLTRWRTERDFTARDAILEEILESGMFPEKDEEVLEENAGLYPDIEDPGFLPKLMRKREYLESKQSPLAEQATEPPRSTEEFELTPTQRFVSRFLNPRTPYRGALLFHGVGVGKTCAAITVAESFLDAFPSRKVYIIAPRNIQEGFRRTIFDSSPESLILSKKAGNHHRGCTGDVYLNITGTYGEEDRDKVVTKVNRAIRDRYTFFGYTSFYNYIMDLIASIGKFTDADQFEKAKKEILRNEFSNRVIIIDEAHNLRDNPLEDDADASDDTADESTEAKAGKKLTPYLREVLDISEGTTLLLMTATPMFNSFVEIVFLLNLLLTNDKLAKLRPEDIFDIKGQEFLQGGQKLLGRVASQYISFMRGENPLTFPLRLKPEGPAKIRRWPSKTPKNELINPGERAGAINLPCYQCFFDVSTEKLYKRYADAILGGRAQGEDDTTIYGMGITNMEVFTQAGNWIFPGEEETDFYDRIRQQGFENTFSREKQQGLICFRSTNEDLGAGWLLEEQLNKASAKTRELIRRVNKCQGVSFVYSRFVAAGALAIALALEANGYTAYGRDIGYLVEGNQHPDGRQCALCPLKERGHGLQPASEGIAEHKFTPAKYILLTGSPELSPDNTGMINAARDPKNVDGSQVKVILGSQIAGEGLDLRFVREVFVFDSWYHLNKLEQIVGRGIRNRSHMLLKEEKRNCTVTLLTNSYTQSPDVETVDLYTYRTALNKARFVGEVTRVLKEHAIDCTLNKDAIIIKDLDTMDVRDSQGVLREDQDINDTPYTALCDWLETCEYECKKGDGEPMPPIPELVDQDSSTYDEYTARLQLGKIKTHLQERIAKGTPFVTFETLEKEFQTIPRPLLANLLNQIIEQKDMIIHTANGDGKIVYRNGYYLFQPEAFRDTTIPIAIRTASIPVPRDVYEPRSVEISKKATTAAASAASTEDSEELWEQAKLWTESIRAGTAGPLIPQTLMNEVNKLKESEGIEKAQKEKLDMILYMYENIKTNEEVRGKFADVVLEYMWDEFLTLATQRELLSTQWEDPILQKTARDAFWEYEEAMYMRLVNGATNQIEYLCLDGASGTVTACPRAIAEVLARETGADPLLQRPIDVRYTGFEYGFINHNPKKKKLVFKKGRPPMPRGKISRGSECSINAGTTYELKLLERFGEVLGKAGGDTLGMTAEELGSRPIKNSVRVCTVSDLVLRYMDFIKSDGKRWFYRALESKLHGHPLR
jgi:hypothetical protein